MKQALPANAVYLWLFPTGCPCRIALQHEQPFLFFFLAFLFLRCILPSNAVLGCRYLSLISSLDLQYSVFKVRSAQNKESGQGKLAFLWSVSLFCIACLHAMSSFAANAGRLHKTDFVLMGLSGPFLPCEYLYRMKVSFLKPNGLKWTRTTDLTLIRRAL